MDKARMSSKKKLNQALVDVMFEAATKHQHTILETLLHGGCNVDVSNKHGETLLMACCVGTRRKRNIWEATGFKMVSLLLDNGADVNIADEKGWTCLMYAHTYRAPLYIMQMFIDAEIHRQDIDIKRTQFKSMYIRPYPHLDKKDQSTGVLPKIVSSHIVSKLKKRHTKKARSHSGSDPSTCIKSSHGESQTATKLPFMKSNSFESGLTYFSQWMARRSSVKSGKRKPLSELKPGDRYHSNTTGATTSIVPDQIAQEMYMASVMKLLNL